jgi:hypothetical protein
LPSRPVPLTAVYITGGDVPIHPSLDETILEIFCPHSEFSFAFVKYALFN